MRVALFHVEDIQMAEQHHQSADQAMRQGNLAGAIIWIERAVADDPADFDGWLKLAALRRASRDLAGSLDAANSALGVRPNELIALTLKATLHDQLGEIGRAAEVYRAVVRLADEENNLNPTLADQVVRARAFLDNFGKRLGTTLKSMSDVDPVHQEKADRFLENVHERRPVYHQDPTHYRYPGLADIEYFDHAYPDLINRLRQAWPDIRAEYEALAAAHADRLCPYVDFAPGQPMGQWAPLNRSPDWNVFHLIRYGELDPHNARLCPRTLEAMAGPHQADVPGIAPNLLFSILAPKTRIPPHTGVGNFRTLLHLPLIVPEGCGFRVGADTRTWVEGCPWIFDDTIEHEAWNESDHYRIIMIADLWRPELDHQDRAIVRNFIRAQAANSEIGAL